ncbi:hypothetical protein [Nonomuraea sp. NPDC023979]|uniref:hypothetical protein n=1 Tax=Nonomuraea sp. NPDC023979 TaxID=3154796 RepID=UPI00340A4043
MPKYRVQMARVTWLTANVEADNEDEALEKAHGIAPAFTARECGWGSVDKWTADADEWQPLDKFYAAFGEYDPEQHGLVIECADYV